MTTVLWQFCVITAHSLFWGVKCWTRLFGHNVSFGSCALIHWDTEDNGVTPHSSINSKVAEKTFFFLTFHMQCYAITSILTTWFGLG